MDREKLVLMMQGAVTKCVPSQDGIDAMEQNYTMRLHDLTDEQKTIWFLLFSTRMMLNAYGISAKLLKVELPEIEFHNVKLPPEEKE